ncbi:UDP-N-acetylmuramoylalanine--D-glutamate ligase [Sphingomonas sp. S17]|uniref:UDP-N-acetylmuramoylalanine--D-glutamate ligase n=2 Tax=Sphingomonas paucimobilis TaxID=13689 RepID=A0A411LHX7_SPHPI|nr:MULTISPECIES: UDP-N-acetylmuramoyl-L-alanine--D-glutamate ligase [Sphingomonas]EGI54933.1 UDP-N-acetylmuramoylalanine--D-glutamate ligase [Sphingomonas sp. S17]MBQ1479466.1 UDP-N-acetylmuramoyl-L-alanine--D-glutamate ligase [Sphingomonas sp.]MCM3678035.1 UDP-N-acetylmuramoyl-L-alanine--D-glutamate ligase [Sphingomonas paucimobilis]MDG5972667.1 UDP-N-acetylmuramoyl-L-alanine--D-glutamate ligase [Sphingomonas paucimobilis]NNG59204.1 UDP-N-acetylmuramoyl-L-alanine--D-glutamate ligase [Sphingom
MIVASDWAGKTFAVLGLARSGAATVSALFAGGGRVVAWDSEPAKREAFAAHDGLSIAPLDDMSGFDALVVSPGVPLNTHPLAAAARAAGVPVIGDIELFAQARKNLPPHKVVGITGTNGKSTTTALVHHILKTAGVPTLMGGNIGLPILGQAPLPEGGVYVLELSSYQIDLTQSLDCDVAVLLNITPDHLDRYDGFAGYAASKARLFAMQTAGHVAVVGTGDEASANIAQGLAGRTDDLVTIAPDTVIDQRRWPALHGPHNAQNAQAAIAVTRALGIDEAAIEAGLASYASLPHRMQHVATRNGVAFVNDSKATNPESTAPALAAFPRVHWIVGGKRKGDDLDACAAHLDHVVAAYTIGEAAPLFFDLLKDKVPVVEQSGTLEAAVVHAAAAARPGDTVLLSPACASFDQFRDYEARGDAFRAAVEALA